MGTVKTEINKTIWKSSFSAVRASGVDEEFSIISLGSGMAQSQSSGNLVVTTGTTANSETIIRSSRSFDGNLALRYALTLSQRIANNNFYVEMVDVLGDALQFTMLSATQIRVTIPRHPFSALNVGQSVNLGAFSGLSGVIPGRYAIAAVSGDDVTFTVSGFPSSGSGTVSVFGWNYYQLNYDGTTATQVKFNTQRNGWNTTDSTLNVNTSASPGHMGVMVSEDQMASFHDLLVASSTNIQGVPRGTRITAVPDPDIKMFVQIRALNGTSAPATTTTLTIGSVSVEMFESTAVQINGIRPHFQSGAMPVSIERVGLSGTSSQAIQGPTAHDAVISGNPFRLAGRAVTANYTAVASGDVADLITTVVGAPIVRPFSIPELDWQGTITITNTTSTALKTAAGAGLKNYLTTLTFQNANATATQINVLRGTTVVASFQATANMALPATISFATPIQTAANEALNVQAVTTGANVLVNGTGYVAP